MNTHLINQWDDCPLPKNMHFKVQPTWKSSEVVETPLDAGHLPPGMKERFFLMAAKSKPPPL